MKNLIINADDFGLTRGVNEAIIQAHKCGVLTSATLMAGGLAWQEAVDLALATPTLGVGVHLTLTALGPVLPPEQVPSLVDKRGRFRKQFWRAPLWNKDQVKREWRAQIQRLVNEGLRPTHLDSHHHIHLWPTLTDIACQLAEEFGIKAVRAISPRSMELMLMGRLAWERYIVSWSWRRAGKFSLAKPGTVVGIEALPRTQEGLDEYLAKLEVGVHELFCHPGIVADPQLAPISSLRDKRARETEMLCSDWFKKILGQHQINLTSFKYFVEERV